MDNIYLEYQENGGNFHYNKIFQGQPHHQLDTAGYATIAFTPMFKASLFCDIMQKKNIKHFITNHKHLSLATIKEEWRYFCFYFDFLIHRSCVLQDPEFMEYAQSLKEFNVDTELDKLNYVQ